MTEIDHIVADARYEFHSEVASDIDLLEEIAAEVIRHEFACQGRHILCGIRPADISRGYYQVRRIFGVGHYAVAVVDIEVVAVDRLYPHHRESLRDTHIHHAGLILIAFCRAHERRGKQSVLYLAAAHSCERPSLRIEMQFLESCLHFLTGDEPVGSGIRHRDVDIRTYALLILRLVEG